MKTGTYVLYKNHTGNMAQPQYVLTRTATRPRQEKLKILLNGKKVEVPINSCISIADIRTEKLFIDPSFDIPFQVIPQYATFGT